MGARGQLTPSGGSRLPSLHQPLHIHRLQAVRAVHYPEALEHAEAGRRRLAFDELFLLQLKLLLKRALQRCSRVCRASGSV